MSWQVTNLNTGEIGVSFPDDQQYEDLSKEACKALAKATPGLWVVVKIEEVYRVDSRTEEQKVKS